MILIKIENVETHGITRAVYSARNAMNSWYKSDSDLSTEILGKADLTLAKKLATAGTDHRKFMRMITVTADITTSLYWWKEFDTYKVGTVANSCSTMHTIHKKEFALNDFSHEHLFDDEDNMAIFKSSLSRTIADLNTARNLYLKTKDKKYWWQVIQLLPSSYNQRRTVMLNYEVLSNIYKSRRNHRLDEWREFCKWIETLPYSELITGEKESD